MLLAAEDLALDAGFLQRLFQAVLDALQELALIALGLAHGLVEHAVAERVGVAEAEVLELGLDAC